MHSFLKTLAEYKYNAQHDPEYGACGPLVDLVVEQFGLILPVHVPELSIVDTGFDASLFAKESLENLNREIRTSDLGTNVDSISLRKPGASSGSEEDGVFTNLP